MFVVGTRFDYEIYKYSERSNTPAPWYCARVYGNESTTGVALDLLMRLCDNHTRVANVNVVCLGRDCVLEIKWPPIKVHDLRPRTNGCDWFAQSNMTPKKALREVEIFNAKFNDLLATPNAWPA